MTTAVTSSWHFRRVRQELAIDEKINYRVVAHSTTRTLRPAIRDEVYRIGREALTNAFLHSRASTIEVEVEYATRYLRIIVRDGRLRNRSSGVGCWSPRALGTTRHARAL